MKPLIAWLLGTGMALALLGLAAPGLLAQSNADLVKKRAKDLKKDVEAKYAPTNTPARKATNAPAGKPKPAPPKKAPDQPRR